MSRLLALLVTLVVVAGCASSPRSAQAPRIDGSSEAAFKESVTSLLKSLTQDRHTFAVIALKDIWRTAGAEADPASSDADRTNAFLARINGLGYKELIALADATPPTVREQYYAMNPHSPAALPRGNAGPSGGTDTRSAATDYTGYGLQGMPQYSTSCGSVCSR